MNRLGIIGAAGVVVAVALIWIFYRGGEPSAPEPSVTSAPVAKLTAPTKPAAPADTRPADQKSSETSAAPAPDTAAPAPVAPAPAASGDAAPAAKETPAAKEPPAVKAAPVTGELPPPKIVALEPTAPSTAEPPPIVDPSPMQPPPAPQAAVSSPVGRTTATPQKTAPETAAPQAAIPKPPVVAALPPAPKTIVPATPVAPSFDVVRVEPNGDAVIAGRAPPGWEVIVRDGAEVIGRVIANSRGEWVLLPDKRFPPGNRELRLSARAPDGRVLESDRIVALAVPERRARSGDGGAATAPPLAVELPKSGKGPAKILQGARSQPEDTPVLAIDIIEYDGEGNIVVAGRASAGGTVRVYLDDRYLGESLADAEGAWRLVPEYRLRPGSFTLWAVELDGEGRAIARVEVSFEHGVPIANWPEGREIIIVHGHTLWWIARRLYGQGARYAVIFEANRDSIRDPDLIYPGQKFSLPQVD